MSKNGNREIQRFRVSGIPIAQFEKGRRVTADAISALNNDSDITKAIQVRSQAACARRAQKE